MNMPNEYPTARRSNRTLVGCIASHPIKIIPNDPVMRYRYSNNNVAHFYMYDQNQWWWCGYCFCWIKNIPLIIET
jgi:hypothetical protein